MFISNPAVAPAVKPHVLDAAEEELGLVLIKGFAKGQEDGEVRDLLSSHQQLISWSSPTAEGVLVCLTDTAAAKGIVALYNGFEWKGQHLAVTLHGPASGLQSARKGDGAQPSWRISSAPDLPAADDANRPEPFGQSNIASIVHEQAGGDTGSPWTPHTSQGLLSAATDGQWNLLKVQQQMDLSYSEHASSVVDALLGGASSNSVVNLPADLTSNDLGLQAPSASAAWPPSAGLLGGPSYSLGGLRTVSSKLGGSGLLGNSTPATPTMTDNLDHIGPSTATGMSPTPSQRSLASIARDDSNRFATVASLGASVADSLASHGLMSSPWSTSALATGQQPSGLGPIKGPSQLGFTDHMHGMGGSDLNSLHPSGGGAANAGPDNDGYPDLTNLDLSDPSLIGALTMSGFQPMNLPEQILLLQAAQQEAAQQQAAVKVAAMHQALMMQRQQGDSQRGQAVGSPGKPTNGLDGSLLSSVPSIKSARSVQQSGFNPMAGSRLGDPGRLMGEDPMSPLQQQFRVMQMGNDLQSRASFSMEDAASWQQGNQDMAQFLGMAGQHSGMMFGDGGMRSNNATPRATRTPSMRSGYETSESMGGNGTLSSSPSQGLPGTANRARAVDPRLPHKLVATAAQVGLSPQTLWILIKHPVLLDMIVRERDSMRGTPPPPPAPANPALARAALTALAGASAGATSPARKTGQDALKGLDPAKRQEELTRTQTALSELVAKTASYLNSPQVQSLITTLAPIANLYDTMHDLPVVQKRKRCVEMGDLRLTLIQQPGVKEAVALLAKLRYHLFSLTSKLLLLNDAGTEAVPLDILLGCLCTELSALVKPLVSQEAMEVMENTLPNARLALLVFVEFTTVDPVAPK